MYVSKRQKGVTILELMITVAILAIVVTTVTPSVQNMLIQNRIVAEVNEMSAILQYARAIAIDEQTDTVVCPSTDYATCGTNWNNAKIMFTDLDGDGDRDDDEELLASSSPLSSTNHLDGPEANISFQGNGAVSSPATLLFCHQDKDNEYARALIISLQGRVKLSQDSDNDGIHEDNAGTSLDCS